LKAKPPGVRAHPHDAHKSTADGRTRGTAPGAPACAAPIAEGNRSRHVPD
jgi:hypothetical protein